MTTADTVSKKENPQGHQQKINNENYDLEDLRLAQAHLDHLDERRVNSRGNNPNSFDASIKEASRKVRTITAQLKKNGVLALTEYELLEQKLDVAFPKAKSREIVEFEGQTYQLRFFPLEKSRSGKTVKEWGRCWEVQK